MKQTINIHEAKTRLSQLLQQVEKGDEIITVGGELGRVLKVGENYISLEIAENVTVLIQTSAVQTVLPKGTIKSI